MPTTKDTHRSALTPEELVDATPNSRNAMLASLVQAVQGMREDMGSRFDGVEARLATLEKCQGSMAAKITVVHSTTNTLAEMVGASNARIIAQEGSICALARGDSIPPPPTKAARKRKHLAGVVGGILATIVVVISTGFSWLERVKEWIK